MEAKSLILVKESDGEIWAEVEVSDTSGVGKLFFTYLIAQMCVYTLTDYCSYSVTCIVVTVFVTFLVFYGVVDSFSGQ